MADLKRCPFCGEVEQLELRGSLYVMCRVCSPMLSDEEIQYIREWAASGNEPRLVLSSLITSHERHTRKGMQHDD